MNTPAQIEAVLTLLRTAREPRSTSDLWEEITLCGQKKPDPDMPQKVAHLANLMLDMALKGMVIERHGQWTPVAQKPKAPPPSLF